MPVNGTMTGVSIQFKQASADPVMWSLEGTVSPATISTGIDLRDQHMKRSDYFDIAHYPVTSLRSTGIVTKGKNNYEGTFSLTIKGVTKSVIIPFTIRKTNGSMDIEGIFTINRLDYGLGKEVLYFQTMLQSVFLPGSKGEPLDHIDTPSVSGRLSRWRK